MSTSALNRVASFRDMLPSKLRATGIHISISLVIFAALLYMILVEWYPGALFHTDGGWQGIRLVFAVDVVLGPLLTFVVFSALKPRREIVFDLSLIAAVQTAALLWGVYTIYTQHPVAMVEYDGTFHSVTTEAYTSQNIDPAVLKKYDTHEPAVVYQRKPQDAADVVALFTMKEEWQQFAQVSMYESFRERLPQVFAHAVAFETQILKEHPQLAREFQEVRERHDPTVNFLPFKGRYGTVILTLTREGEILDFLPMPMPVLTP